MEAALWTIVAILTVYLVRQVRYDRYVRRRTDEAMQALENMVADIKRQDASLSQLERNVGDLGRNVDHN